ncbi:MAG: NYN domain-containing protein [Azonexus sp.]|nr:NYN domain-containing protein [Betaproteobacteria bacterium]MBK8917835.1 NYN domain-containing protein [Betaproteobacteria bacterium]MBP6035922.1 NYN domain-containing protein [Azonexus sp.]MBP6906260.1 NYN domain-containing protein [Azonexus sp.]
MKTDLPNFALLIDADNDTPNIVAPIIEEITRDARLSVRRVYGDFTTPQLAKWRESLSRHGIHPIQQFRNTVGKNASDSALIIDAMDLLHGRRLDGFCLVSSDGDFTRLATRIREDGLTVIGCGRTHAPKSFVSACERYIYVENLSFIPEVKSAAEEAAIPPSDALQNPKKGSSPGAKTHPPATEAPAPELPVLRKLLQRAYTNVADEDGWALVSRIAVYLRANHSDFDPRSHGAANFIKLLQACGGFELKQRQQGNGTAHFCRPAPVSAL